MPTRYYNPTTKKTIDTLSLAMPHALLLEGPDGVGLLTLARDVAWHNLGGIVQSTDAKGAPDQTSKGVIRVSQIRELVEQSRSKLTEPRIYIIDEADKMNHQAQNAFLKLLEEPNEHLTFILTTHAAQALLPTVLSRVQRVLVSPINTAQSKKLVSQLGITDQKKAAQLLFLADGRPAEITRLVTDEKRFATVTARIADARTLLQGSIYERAMVTHKYASDRAAALDLLRLSQKILTHTLRRQPLTSTIHACDRLADTYDRIATNGNIRLQLMHFVLQ